MKATEAKVLNFIKKSQQFIVPIYQRAYSWTTPQCQQLWNDVLRAGEDDEIQAHFIGSIVYIEKGLYQVSNQSPLLVIDGQQRLTTVTLLIEALARAVGNTEPLDGFSEKKLRNYYLLNPEETDERKYKVLLSQTDKGTLKRLVDGSEPPADHSIRVSENFRLFESLLADLSGEKLVSVCKGLSKLLLVDIALTRGQDDPQLIFESMNSTGLDLTQADLIRNYILMGMEPELQAKLYEEYWRPMEKEFGQVGYQDHFDKFMRHHITVETGSIPNIQSVYSAFKEYEKARRRAGVGTETLLGHIKAHSRRYAAMALGLEKDPELSKAFGDLRDLKVDVAYPFLLQLYADHAAGELSKPDFLAILRLVESYVFRRAVCAIPTHSLNKTFSNIGKAVRKDRYLESVAAYFIGLPDYKRFPPDDEFIMEFQRCDLYKPLRRSYWLRRLENHDKKEHAAVENYTIEHIMPQNPKLSDEWKESLGPDHARIHQELLHTLGNLTLTGYNPEYGDRPFAQKRDMEGGFAQSTLRLNQRLGSVRKWDEAAIRDRAARLAALAITVWPAPAVGEMELSAYLPVQRNAVYGAADHPQLSKSPTRELFQAFRMEVIALDPSVVEEYTKLYIAYKSETNFVDVVPQAARLRLSLNVTFPEINDPRGLCKDVSSVGRWGNGDVEIMLTCLGDIPYVVGLVKQSLDTQLPGSGED